MPPIPVHLDDPITPQKPTGTTPQTAGVEGEAFVQAPGQAPATTTATAATQPYPSAKPGQTAVPVQTATPFNPPRPTRTTQSETDGPPPPQPGAVPVPLAQRVGRETLPPPPKAGEVAQSMPPQMAIPSPSENGAATRSTSTIPPPPTAATVGGARTVDLGPVGPSTSTASTAPVAPAGVPTAPHRRPEGYVQDTNAQELSAAQRRSLEDLERRESVFGGANAGTIGGGGEGVGEAAAGAWSAVKAFVGTAGEKLAGAEEEVWKRFGGAK